MRKGGRDVLAQAMTGVMHRRADPGLPLSIYPTALADYAAGMHLVQGILLALLQRERTGKGQEVFVSLYDSMLAMQMQEAAMRLMRGRDLNWAAMPLAGVFETADGAIVMVGAFKENPLREICRALRLDDLSADPKYANLEQQKAHRAELQALFRETFAGDTTARWVERLEAVDVLCAPIRTLEEALDDPRTAHNRMIVESAPTAAGPVRLIGSPIEMSSAPFEIRHPPPAARGAPRGGARGAGRSGPDNGDRPRGAGSRSRSGEPEEAAGSSSGVASLRDRDARGGETRGRSPARVARVRPYRPVTPPDAPGSPRSRPVSNRLRRVLRRCARRLPGSPGA